MDEFIGIVKIFAGNFAPRGWAYCNGQLMSIAQNEALYAILGTTYGGDGVTTFGLPDLRGRTPIGPGQGKGLTNRVLGEASGVETVTLLTTSMPAHTHLASAVTAVSDKATPGGNLWATEATGSTLQFSDQAPNTAMSPRAIGAAGGSQPHDNMQPYLGISFIICLEGLFPSQN